MIECKVQTIVYDHQCTQLLAHIINCTGVKETKKHIDLPTTLFKLASLALHYSDVIMSATASQITGVSIVCLSVCWGSNQWKHQSSASVAFVRGIHWWPVDFRHKGPQKMPPLDNVIMGAVVDCLIAIQITLKVMGKSNSNKYNNWCKASKLIAPALTTIWSQIFKMSSWKNTHKKQQCIIAYCLLLVFYYIHNYYFNQ